MCVDLRSMEYYEVEEAVLNLGEKNTVQNKSIIF